MSSWLQQGTHAGNFFFFLLDYPGRQGSSSLTQVYSDSWTDTPSDICHDHMMNCSIYLSANIPRMVRQLWGELQGRWSTWYRTYVELFDKELCNREKKKTYVDVEDVDASSNDGLVQPLGHWEASSRWGPSAAPLFCPAADPALLPPTSSAMLKENTPTGINASYYYMSLMSALSPAERSWRKSSYTAQWV